MKNAAVNHLDKKTQFKGAVILLLTAVIWGTSFVSQTIGSNTVPAFTFMGIRTLIGGFFLLPLVLIRNFQQKRRLISAEEKKQYKINNLRTIRIGIIVGVFLCCATCFQQFAFYQEDASTGKIAFITAMYMFFVPIIGLVFFRKKIPLLTWVCICAGFAGLYFLCFKEGGFQPLKTGDLLGLICALFFAFQILSIEKLGSKCDGIMLSCVEFFSAGIITTVLMLIFEHPPLHQIKAGILPILYSGIMSCGFAYTMQVIGQKYCEATIASLLMCTESVFATLFAAVFLHESLSAREITGCFIMFAAIVISQFVNQEKKN